MTSEGTSSISLTVSSLSQKDHTAYSSTAFALAEAFHSDFLRCTDETQRRKVCCDYRDKILGISKFTDILAAAFNDAFPRSLRESIAGKHKKAWTEFAGLVQRQKKSQDCEAQRLQHQTCIISIWGKDVFEHYGWHKLPLESSRLLHSVACTLRHWDSAVESINEVILERHGRRVAQNQNNAKLIGEHPPGSKIQDCRSPVERQDIQAILARLKDNNLLVRPRTDPSKDRVYTIDGTPIRNYGLERDDFGMIVPQGAPGVVRESSSPTVQASKRRKITKSPQDSSSESENLPATLSSQQRKSTPAYTTSSEISEMTDFEEESSDEMTSVESDRDASMFTGKDLPRDDGNNTETLTSGSSVNVSVSAFQRLERPHTSHSTRRDTSRGSHAGSLEQVYQVSEDMNEDMDLNSFGKNETSAEPQNKDHDRYDETSTSNSLPARHHGSPRSSSRENSPDDSGAILDAGHERPSSGIQRSQEHFVFSHNVEGTSRPMSSGSSPVVVATIEDSHLSIAGESGSLDPQSSDPTIDIRNLREEVAEEEAQTEIETRVERHGFDSVAVSNPATQIENPEGSNQAQEVQVTGPGQAIVGETTRDSGIHSLPTPIGRFIPVPTCHSLNGYCTDTNVENDGTIIGRMASRHASQLRNELDAAREYSRDRNIRTHNELKVNWLENTRWANVYDAPTDTNPALAFPLNVDVWYMQWETFQKRADAGEAFSKPVVIKQKFQDSGMHQPQDYLALLKERYPYQAIDVQDSKTGGCQKMKIQDFWAARSENDSNPTKLAEMANVINLRKIANADAPLLTRLKRFRLLETLIERASNITPGKRSCREANDISDCLGFDLLGSEGAFTRPHVDALMGTWIRCLSGAKAWIFAPSMSGKDWHDFTQEGPSWSPAEKGRVVVLEKDDVLLMPPGMRVLHTVFTLEPSLMEGGMLWDECNIPSLLDELLWVLQNQICTNEAVAYQLPSIIDALEGWVQENSILLSAIESPPDYVACVHYGIRSLRDLGCKCGTGCVGSGCQCRVQGLRCTAWCLKHPVLPGSADDQDHGCMSE
jgi:hypothetical protein